MSLLACNKERTGSILHAHGGVCSVVCVNVHGYLCVAHACVCGCVYMCISVCIHVCQCLLNGGYKSTSILSVITQVQNTHTVLAIADFFLVTCLQLTQCNITVCTYNFTVCTYNVVLT